MRARTVSIGLVSTFVVAILALPVAADPGPDHSITLTAGSGPQSWDGAAATGTNQSYDGASGEPCPETPSGADDYCEQTLLHLDVASPVNAEVSLDLDPVNDFDLYAYASDASGSRGALVDQSAGVQTLGEAVQLHSGAGYFLIQVVYFQTIQSGYGATAQITTTGGGAPPARTRALTGRTLPVGTETFEPTIGADGNGRLFYSVTPPGPGVAIGFRAGTFRSEDQGRTWTDVSPPGIGPFRYPPETNDPYIYVDQMTDRVFQFHMAPLLTCSMLAWSDDAGATWTRNPAGCFPTGVWDHQTMVAAKPRGTPTVGYPNVLVQCVSNVAAAMCARSLNGGLTWGPSVPVHLNAGPQDGNLCGAQHGHLEAAPDGTLYLPTSLCGSRPTVFVSRDSGITWAKSQVADINVPLSDPDIGIDREGNIYVAFLDESGALLFSVSQDQGRTWASPVRIGDGLTAGLPAVAAGDPGRVVVSFVGTDDLPQGYATPGYPDNATGDIAWAPYLALSADALSSQPTFGLGDAANGDPISRGAECSADGFRCTVQIDFIEVTIAPNGRPYAAFVDGCYGPCITNPNAPVDTDPPSPAIVATLVRGPSLCKAGCPWRFGEAGAG
jgi:hypothetical protein